MKNAVICNLLLRGQKIVSRGEIDGNGFFQGRLHRFWISSRNTSALLRHAPSYEQITAFCLNSSGGKTRKNAVITTHVFARLVVVLTEREEASAAVIQSGQTLTRIEQQRRHDRDSFWESIVARFHNDKTVIIMMEYGGIIDSDDEQTLINPNLPPPQRRTGAWLKEKYYSVRSLFTKAHHNWTVSGHNDSEDWSFHKFVPRAPSSTEISFKVDFSLLYSLL